MDFKRKKIILWFYSAIDFAKLEAEDEGLQISESLILLNRIVTTQ